MQTGISTPLHIGRSPARAGTRHLRADDPGHWPEVTLDLTGARLVDFDAADCTLVDADFTRAVFTGATSFAGVTARGRLRLGAVFGDVVFDDLAADAEVVLDDARFEGSASFDGAWLSRPPQVDQARAAAGAGHAWPAGTTVERLDDEWLLLVDR